MSKRFVLVDHSLVGHGGHHYDYALQVLDCARNMGYRTELVTNLACISKELNGHPVKALYDLNFWGETEGESKKSSFLMNSYIALRNAWLKARVKNLHMLLGRDSFLLTSSADSTGPFQNGLVRIILRFESFLWVKFPSALKRHFSKICSSIKNTLRTSSCSYNGLSENRDHFISTSFFHDTQRMMNFLNLDENDVVFIPNISDADLEGIELFLRANPSCRTRWALLFRRNLYEKTEQQYTAWPAGFEGLRELFTKIVQSSTARHVSFFTDTEELTRQYAYATGHRFHTLPIPHTRPGNEKSQNEIVVSYLGDARLEKGFQHLPLIVETVMRKKIDDNVRFVFQSNLAALGGEQAVITAREQLEVFFSEKVQLIKSPLSSHDYELFLSQSSIVLLPYDRGSYNARSSGILVEALANGIPVIVPAGSWLSRQILDNNIEYYDKLLEAGGGRRELVQKPAVRGPHGARCGNGGILLGEFSVQRDETHCFVELQGAVSDLDFFYELGVTINPALTFGNTFVNVAEHSAAHGKASLMVPLGAGTQKISIKLLETANFPMDLSVKISFVSLPEYTPVGRGGRAYSNILEIPDILLEMIGSLAHYRQATQKMAKTLLHNHNAENLVTKILQEIG
ncbi:glycosyltransferase family 4 protein [Desulfovibrio sp. JC022]|uniref:glycosyltransferase family 4 protein n=1 Tax=Desulfovibrio sp. JC022 TaxID=2593642 RepID=UPI0013CFE052|nr:glycosyltransferase family 4 protein [Desulfovibrio sp. JC022]NDV24956.1 glycosyltransferase family 4 protein [Desulfovibrio sp. JC022]